MEGRRRGPAPVRYGEGVYFAERQIEEAIERGEFDDLEGAGKPIPDLDGDYDPLWWVRSFVQRSRAQEAAWALRREIRRARVHGDVDRLRTLRDAVAEVNRHLDPDERLEPL